MAGSKFVSRSLPQLMCLVAGVVTIFASADVSGSRFVSRSVPQLMWLVAGLFLAVEDWFLCSALEKLGTE